MNKFINKIAVAMVGIAMAVGVGVAVGSSSGVARLDAAITDNDLDTEHAEIITFSDVWGTSSNHDITSAESLGADSAYKIAQGGSGTQVVYNSGSKHIRVYVNRSIIFSSTTKKIGKIVFTNDQGDANDVDSGTYNSSTDTWVADNTTTTSVELTNTTSGSSGQWRVSKVVITPIKESGTPSAWVTTAIAIAKTNSLSATISSSETTFPSFNDITVTKTEHDNNGVVVQDRETNVTSESQLHWIYADGENEGDDIELPLSVGNYNVKVWASVTGEQLTSLDNSSDSKKYVSGVLSVVNVAAFDFTNGFGSSKNSSGITVSKNTYNSYTPARVYKNEIVTISGDSTVGSISQIVIETNGTGSSYPQNTADDELWTNVDSASYSESTVTINVSDDTTSLTYTASTAQVQWKSMSVYFNPVEEDEDQLVESIVLSTEGDVSTIATVGSVEVTASVGPGSAADKSVTWSVETTGGVAITDSSIASVSENAQDNLKATFTAPTAGTYVVRATANDGSDISGTITITSEVRKAYTKLQDVTKLVNGAKVIIGRADGNSIASTYNSTDGRLTALSTSSTNGVIIPGGTYFEFTVGLSSNGYTFYDGTNYLCYVGNKNSKGNEIEMVSSLDSTCYWSVGITAEGVASITNKEASTRTIYFNSTFYACYTSSQTAISLYMENVADVTSTQSLDAFGKLYLRSVELALETQPTNISGTSCLDAPTGSGYYLTAKTALNGTWASVKTAMQSDSTGIKLRYESWASAYGDSTPYSNTVNANGLALGKGSNGSADSVELAIATISSVSLAAIGGFFFIRKKKIIK